MGLSLAGVGNTGLLTPIGTPLVIGPPFTVAGWVNQHHIADATSGTFFSLTQSSTSSNHFSIVHDGLSGFQIEIAVTGSSAVDSAVIAVPDSAWVYLVGRFISATNRRLSAYVASTGTLSHVQELTSKTPATPSMMSIGAFGASGGAGGSLQTAIDGQIGEFWYTGTDIQSDGGQLDNNLLMRLAFGGPFSVPHVAENIKEYFSFRDNPLPGSGTEYYCSGSPQVWFNKSATIGQHPPLPYWYAKPGQDLTVLTV